ncbi:MAG TPA: hypothetical protein GX497_13720 [Bacillus bacterium]|nr:hypothetical protein [Bacillus sp. (in: firmicutes)]
MNELIKLLDENLICTDITIQLTLIIADELSHLCGVLSHPLRRKEPPFAKLRATIVQPLFKE